MRKQSNQNKTTTCYYRWFLRKTRVRVISILALWGWIMMEPFAKPLNQKNEE